MARTDRALRSKQQALEAFGAAVRKRRQREDLSLEGLAELAELHWTYVGGIERGERNISLVSMLRLARGLRAHPADLLRDAYPGQAPRIPRT